MRSFAIDDRPLSDEHVAMTIQTSRLRCFHVCGMASVLDQRAVLRLKWAIGRDGLGEDINVIAGGWLRAR